MVEKGMAEAKSAAKEGRMITGTEGGFCHRMMPPVNWDCGPIPDACYDKNLSIREIQDLLVSVYLSEGRIRKLADSDDEIELFRARIALEVLAEIDAGTIWACNSVRQ